MSLADYAREVSLWIDGLTGIHGSSGVSETFCCEVALSPSSFSIDENQIPNPTKFVFVHSTS